MSPDPGPDCLGLISARNETRSGEEHEPATESWLMRRRACPVAGVAAAVLINTLWLGFLSYELVKLVYR
jgi:hypothetical protein